MDPIQPLPVIKPVGIVDEDGLYKTPPKTWVVMVDGFSALNDEDGILQAQQWLPPGDAIIRKTFSSFEFINGEFSESKMEAEARDLLLKVLDHRKTGDLITFWACDIGGTLVKLALGIAAREAMFTPILEATHMAIFFGTPHRSSKSYSIDSAFHALLESYHPYLLDERFPTTLNKLSRYSERIGETFNAILHTFSIINYYQKIMPSSLSQVVIPEECAILQVENELILSTSRTHSMMGISFTRHEEHILRLHIFNTKIAHWGRFRHFMDVLASANTHTPNRVHELQSVSASTTAYLTQSSKLLDWISSKACPRYLRVKLAAEIDHRRFLNSIARVVRNHGDKLWAPCPDFDVGYIGQALNDQDEIYTCISLLQQILMQQPQAFTYILHLVPLIIDALMSNISTWKKRALWLGLRALMHAPIGLPIYGFMHIQGARSNRILQNFCSLLGGTDSRLRLVLAYTENVPKIESHISELIDLEIESQGLKDCLKTTDPLSSKISEAPKSGSTPLAQDMPPGLQNLQDKNSMLVQLVSSRVLLLGRPAFIVLIWATFALRQLTILEWDTILEIDDCLTLERDKGDLLPSGVELLHQLSGIVELRSGTIILCISYEQMRKSLTLLSPIYLGKSSPNVYIAQSCISFLVKYVFKEKILKSKNDTSGIMDVERDVEKQKAEGMGETTVEFRRYDDDGQWAISVMNNSHRGLVEYAARNWLFHYDSVPHEAAETDEIYLFFVEDENNILRWLLILEYTSGPWLQSREKISPSIYDEKLRRHLHLNTLEDLKILYQLATRPMDLTGIGRYLIYATEQGLGNLVSSILTDLDDIPKDALLRALAASSDSIYDCLRKHIPKSSELSQAQLLGLAQLSAQILGNSETSKKLMADCLSIPDRQHTADWLSDVLELAIEYGDEEAVNELLANPKPIKQNHWYKTLHRAAAGGNLLAMDKLLDSGYANFIDKLFFDNRTPLFIASSYGFMEVVRLLLVKGARIDDKNGEFKRTALHVASYYGNFNTVKALLGSGAIITSSDTDGNFALHLAIQQAQIRTAELLVDNFPAISQAPEHPTEHDNEDLDFSSSPQNNDDHETFFIDNEHEGGQLLSRKIDDCSSAPLNLANSKGVTVLLAAADRELWTIGQQLLKRGADPNMMDDRSRVALHMASAAGKMEFVQSLLEHKSTIDLEMEDIRFTPLHLACYGGFTPVVETLIECGIDLSVTDEWGRTAFSVACVAGHLDTVKALFHHYERHDHSRGFTYAVQRGHRDIVKFLLGSGCDINQAGANNGSPLVTAASKGNARMIELLLLRGADVEQEDYRGQALHEASRQGHHQVVNLLINAGARIDAESKKGYSALCTAIYYENPRMVRFLLDLGAPLRLCRRWDRYSDVLDFSWGLSVFAVSQVLVEFYKRGRQKDGLTPSKALINAMERGEEELMLLVLDNWFNLDNVKYASAGDAIHYAVSKELIHLLKILLRHPVGKASINEVMSDIGTPLHAAVRTEENSLEIVEILLEEGANAESIAGVHGTALNMACYEGKYDIAKKLLRKLSRNAITSITGKYGSPIQSAIARYKKATLESKSQLLKLTELLELLDERGVSPMVIGGYYCTALHAASICAVPKEVLTWLLDRASRSVLFEDPMGRLPLHMAILRGDWEAIETISRYTEQMSPSHLPESAAAWKYRDFQHLTGLHYAAVSQSETPVLKILKMCRKKEVSDIMNLVNLKDKDGWTPLHWACRKKNRNVVKSLIDNEAITDLRTNEGWTPRQIAILHGVNDDEYLNMLPELPFTGNPLPKGQAEFFGGWCDACHVGIYWYYYHCQDEECDDFDLCFKCYKSVNSIHNTKHEFSYRT